MRGTYGAGANHACDHGLAAGPVQDIVWLGCDALLVVHFAGFEAATGGTTSAGDWLQEIREHESGTFLHTQ